jgi:type II secretory pathway component GspD/PulD (secretin)
MRSDTSLRSYRLAAVTFISIWSLLGVYLAAAQPAAPGAPETKPGEQFVSIDFNNVDISLFIKFMSELTGTNFVVDNAVKGKVTIISPARISRTRPTGCLSPS